MGNAKLLAGFDDPEVMRAVSEVAANPASMSKYQKNAKASMDAFLRVLSLSLDGVMMQARHAGHCLLQGDELAHGWPL